MRPWRCATCAIAAAVLLAGLAVAPANAKRPPMCGARAGDTLVQNLYWRVLSRDTFRRNKLFTEVLACRPRTRATMRLARIPFTSRDNAIVQRGLLAGEYAALLGTWDTGAEQGDFASVVDLARGVKNGWRGAAGEHYLDAQLSISGALLLTTSATEGAVRLDVYDVLGGRTLETGPFSDTAVSEGAAYWMTPMGPRAAPIYGFSPLNAQGFR